MNRILRQRRTMGPVMVLAAAVLFTIGFRTLQGWSAPAGGFSTAGVLIDVATGPVDDSHLLSVEILHLEPGQAPAIALANAGLDEAEAAGALRELGEIVSVRAMQPRDDFRLFRTRDGEMRRLEYQRRAEQCYVVEKGADSFAAHRVEYPVERVVRYLSGDVKDNLHDSVRRAGGDVALVLSLSDLLAWSFDFFTDTRNGDRFEVLVEEEYIEGERVRTGRVLAGRYLPVSDKPLEAFYFAHAEGEKGGYYDREGRSIKRPFLKSPLNYRRISSHFSHSRFHPILKRNRPHLGIDYAAPRGTPVVALGNGKISHAGWIGGYGNTVKIRHNGAYMTQYAHLSKFAKGVRRGTRVEQGQVIGYVGSTGLSTGPHLDFRVQENGRWINPLRLKGGKSEPLPRQHRDAFAARVIEVDRLMGLPDTAHGGGSAAGAGGLGGLLDTPSGS